MSTAGRKFTREEYAIAAKHHGWVWSAAHAGWTHDDEIREGRYEVRRDAEDACWLHEIDVAAALDAAKTGGTEP